jgi:hypothetical protein
VPPPQVPPPQVPPPLVLPPLVPPPQLPRRARRVPRPLLAVVAPPSRFLSSPLMVDGTSTSLSAQRKVSLVGLKMPTQS